MDKLALTEEISKKINQLRLNQVNRVINIDDALVKYEDNIRIKNVRDYVTLSTHQRTILGHDDKSKTGDTTNNYNFILTEDTGGIPKLMDFLELHGGGREKPSTEVVREERPVFPDAISAGASRH